MRCLPASIVYYFIIAIHALLNVLLGFLVFFYIMVIYCFMRKYYETTHTLGIQSSFFLRFQKKWSENCKTPLITKWRQFSQLVYNNKFKCHVVLMHV